MPGMPIFVRNALASFGASFNPQISGKTRALYKPLLRPAVDVDLAPDQPYGSDPRQMLDVYAPPGALSLPVVVYVPGGGFNGGDKRGDDSFYGNVGRWFARQGVIAVIINYRLAPGFPWPAGGEDVRDAMEWTRSRIARFGGDPARIFLFGQSAGATHAATCLFDPAVRNPDSQPLGAVLASGIYRITRDMTAPNIVGYFGPDAGLYESRSPLTHVNTSRVPLFLSIAEFDPSDLSAPTLLLAEAVTRRDGKAPRLLWQQHHNHVSTVLCFDSGEETFGRAVLEFMQQCELDREPVRPASAPSHPAAPAR